MIIRHYLASLKKSCHCERSVAIANFTERTAQFAIASSFLLAMTRLTTLLSAAEEERVAERSDGRVSLLFH
jgi:hypothetical protein